MNAIILAAGLGSRLNPITAHLPKPLVRVNGMPIIERQICFLKEAGIEDIHIVVGHLHELFAYLVDKYQVQLIYNDQYAACNNFYSMFLARQYFGNSYVLEGDVYLSRNFLLPAMVDSAYFCGFKQKIANEWLIEGTKSQLQNIIITSESHLQNPQYKNGADIFAGISYWNSQDAAIICEALSAHVETWQSNPSGPAKNYFWDQVVVNNLSRLTISLVRLNSNDWFEIDKYNELEELAAYHASLENG